MSEYLYSNKVEIIKLFLCMSEEEFGLFCSLARVNNFIDIKDFFARMYRRHHWKIKQLILSEEDLNSAWSGIMKDPLRKPKLKYDFILN